MFPLPATTPTVVQSDVLQPATTEVIVTEDAAGHDAGMAVQEPLQSVVTTADTSVPEPIIEEPTSNQPLPTSLEQIIPTATTLAPALSHRRPERDRKRPSRYDAPTFHFSVREGLAKYKDKAADAIKAELTQLCDKKVFSGVHWKRLSPEQRRKTIRSSMFLKDKFNANGDFEKLKARLVAGGDMQDRTNYDDVSSPTASTSAVFLVAGIAAAERRHVVTMDIGGAYLNAHMKEEVLMSLNKTVAELLCDCRPEYAPFKREDGSIVVKLHKALYGCVESGKLWNQEITRQLKSMGYEQNAYEECVFNKRANGVQCTMVLFVDDIMATCADKSVIDEDIKTLRDKYKELTVHEGLNHSYLGMNFDFTSSRKVRVTMRHYVEDMVSQYRVEGYATSPAADDLFHVDSDSPTLPPERLAEFHSGVAKVLYLAKRVRADCLCATIFLATRVLCATEQDWTKLQRLLRYINSTKLIGTVLEKIGASQVLAYVDASFGVHEDMKSHTGTWITMGKGGIFVKSSKQKLMTKSSTEAELVGMSDAIPMIVWIQNFLRAQGHELKPAIIYQDNKSTIALAEKGRSTSERTRHINIRYYFVKDLIERSEVKVEYLQTEDMIADILTKPLQGEKFRRLRALALNWYE
jgi:hypothetical protein